MLLKLVIDRIYPLIPNAQILFHSECLLNCNRDIAILNCHSHIHSGYERENPEDIVDDRELVLVTRDYSGNAGGCWSSHRVF